jgi:hypothetical protein
MVDGSLERDEAEAARVSLIRLPTDKGNTNLVVTSFQEIELDELIESSLELSPTLDLAHGKVLGEGNEEAVGLVMVRIGVLSQLVAGNGDLGITRIASSHCRGIDRFIDQPNSPVGFLAIPITVNVEGPHIPITQVRETLLEILETPVGIDHEDRKFFSWATRSRIRDGLI